MRNCRGWPPLVIVDETKRVVRHALSGEISNCAMQGQRTLEKLSASLRLSEPAAQCPETTQARHLDREITETS